MERKHQKFPVTLAAKVAQFPYKWHYDMFWVPRFAILAMAVSSPFFLFIHRKVNSPENKAFWAEKRKQEHKYHFD